MPRHDFTYITFGHGVRSFSKGRSNGRKKGRLSGATRWSVDEMIYGSFA